MNIVGMIDKLAGDLETKGLLKEAAMLDVIANTLEKEAYTSGNEPTSAIYKDKLPKAINAVEDLLKKIQGHQYDPKNFKVVSEGVSKIVDEAIEHFNYFKKIFMSKGSLDTLPIDAEKTALDVPMEQERRSLINEVDAVLKAALDVKKLLAHPDPADLQDVSKGLQNIMGLWKKASDIIAKRIKQKG